MSTLKDPSNVEVEPKLAILGATYLNFSASKCQSHITITFQGHIEVFMYLTQLFIWPVCSAQEINSFPLDRVLAHALCSHRMKVTLIVCRDTVEVPTSNLP